MRNIISEQELARSYDHPSKDVWEAVQLYREVLTYPNNWGSQRVATDLGVGRSEIRVWVDEGGKPDAVRAIEFGRANDWFEDDWTATTEAFARLTAITFACGSIATENYRPSWTPSDNVVADQLEADLESVGVGVKHTPREGTKPDEMLPAERASPLGRALAVLGCPVGSKNATSVKALPSFLDDAPPAVRREWVTLYVRERGTVHEGKATRTMQEERSEQYLTSLAVLIEDVTDQPATATERRVTVSADAVRALRLQ